MADVSHTHPFADRGALKTLFERGPTIAADGGRRDAGAPERADREADAAEDELNGDAEDELNGDAEDELNDDAENDSTDAAEDVDSDAAADDPVDHDRMRDVDHTPPHGDGADVDRVFERGGTEEPVESEE